MFCAVWAACGGAPTDLSNQTSGGKADRLGGSSWSSERDLPERWGSQILPRFMQNATFGEFAGVNATRIRYAKFEREDEQGALVILNGRNESYLKYAELVDDLSTLGYSLYLLDHRGQGFSDRLLADPQKGYVDDFDDYVGDVKLFVETVVKQRAHDKIFLLAHSLGGAISTAYLERYPTDFDAIVLSAPLHEFNTGKIPESVARGLIDSEILIGHDTDYAPTQGPYDPSATNDVSHSDVRFAISRTLKAKVPQIILGGSTNHWMKQCFTALDGFAAGASAIAAPILLFQATDDQLVRAGGQDAFCAAAQSCRKVVFQGAGHEILQERDDLRSAALDQIRDFFAEQRSATH